jgi:hypothetical protein
LCVYKEIQETEDVDHHLVIKIEEYKIVECRGDDKFGRKVIVCSACRLPHEDVIKNSEYKTVDKFYNCLLKYKIICFFYKIIFHFFVFQLDIS